MKNYLSAYSVRFPNVITYMLQSTEYDPIGYIKWLYRVDDFKQVMHRRSLDKTSVARAFLMFMRVGILIQVVAGYALMLYAITKSDSILVLSAAILVLAAPFMWAHIVMVPLIIARRLYITPRLKKMNHQTRTIFKNHPGVKIAVAGSYGKTTMKELLTTVLSEQLKVASTPGNKNVATAHYQFAQGLAGDEDVLIVEFGEGKPGDVKEFSEVISPDIAVITGLAPAHLDQYGSIQQAGEDIFSVARKVGAKDSYVNTESDAISEFVQPGQVTFDAQGLDGWKVADPKVDIHGTQFTLRKADKSIHIKSKLIGEHLIGVMAATAVIADRLGLRIDKIEAGFKNTVPYEHRMQPYQLGGAWIIDDTYNGNLQGVKSGTALLNKISGKRKIYVTPGLVEQGDESNAIHVEMGETIALAQPDIVVLMKNSTTSHIEKGLTNAGYSGEVIVQNDPLRFYTSLDQFVASGDIVLMQNDWTDNYV